jgi:serine O-acetyltransferase
MGIARTSELNKRPTIEDRVEIGTGACILGDVTIGHDSVVGANAVVVHSFPPHSTIAGVPARALRAQREAGDHADGMSPRSGFFMAESEREELSSGSDG